MTIEKLPSGNYRIRQMVNGVVYRVTIDHKPTKYEAQELIDKKIQNSTKPYDYNPTLENACNTYIESKKNVMSPSTVAGYRSLTRRIPDSLANMHLDDITKRDIQIFINNYAIDHSPKTTINMGSFILTVLLFYDIAMPTPNYPQKEKEEVYVPTEEEVKQIFAKAKGTKYEVAFFLATMGMRRSEILATTSAKLKGNELTIDSAMVQDENGEWVEKTTKTVSSTRTIVLPDRIAEKLRLQVEAFDGSAESLNNKLHKWQDELDIPRFSFHKLRHFFASVMHQYGMSDAQIQALGGWSTDRTLKAVYRHAMDMDEAKEQAAIAIGNLLRGEK